MGGLPAAHEGAGDLQPPLPASARSPSVSAELPSEAAGLCIWLQSLALGKFAAPMYELGCENVEFLALMELEEAAQMCDMLGMKPLQREKFIRQLQMVQEHDAGFDTDVLECVPSNLLRTPNWTRCSYVCPLLRDGFCRCGNDSAYRQQRQPQSEAAPAASAAAPAAVDLSAAAQEDRFGTESTASPQPPLEIDTVAPLLHSDKAVLPVASGVSRRGGFHLVRPQQYLESVSILPRLQDALQQLTGAFPYNP